MFSMLCFYQYKLIFKISAYWYENLTSESQVLNSKVSPHESIGGGTDCTLSKLADDTELSGADDSTEEQMASRGTLRAWEVSLHKSDEVQEGKVQGYATRLGQF